MGKVKLSDVASRAGVSITTASNVLNGKGRFSHDVKKKVFEAAIELGYQKNVYASSIAGKKISHIGVLFHEDYEKAFEWNFIRHIFIQLESVLTNNELYPIMIPVSLHQKTEDIVKKISVSGVGALFTIHYGNGELFTLMEDQGIPVVVINNSNFQNKMYSVCVDDFQGAYEGTSYLIEMGHKNIIFVEYIRPDHPTLVADRFIGFKKAIDEYGLDFEPEMRITVDLYNTEELREKLSNALNNYSPTAIFAHDDYLAARVIVILEMLNYKVPGNISIIAPGDTLDYNQPFIPKITTMSIDTDMLGKLAGELMLARIKGEINKLQVLKVKQQLIDRGSCIPV